MIDLDHRYMTPPSLRLAQRWATPSGDEVYEWHLRVAQPNITIIPTAILHSIEHFLRHYFTKHPEHGVISVGVMGCATGLYLYAIGIADYHDMAKLVGEALATTARAEAVPLADTVHCGHAANHSLDGAKNMAAWLLHRQDDWQHAGPEQPDVT